MKTLLPQIDTPRCTGCGWCVAACPPHVLSLQTEGWCKHAVLHDAAACTGCSKCERQCPFGVIDMVSTERATKRSGSDPFGKACRSGAWTPPPK